MSQIFKQNKKFKYKIENVLPTSCHMALDISSAALTFLQLLLVTERMFGKVSNENFSSTIHWTSTDMKMVAGQKFMFLNLIGSSYVPNTPTDQSLHEARSSNRICSWTLCVIYNVYWFNDTSALKQQNGWSLQQLPEISCNEISSQNRTDLISDIISMVS